MQDPELADEMYEKAVLMYNDIAPDVQYVDWLEQFRERLLISQCELLRRLGRHALDKGHYVRAEAFFRQWIKLSPLAEEAYQELLRVFWSQGRHSEAEFVYRQLEHKLQQELGVLPLSETRSIIRR
jgi:DNA-binding SARP family transcriptional activator